MTGKERISRILNHQPVDRIGIFEHFWGDTYKQYLDQGHIKEGESFEDNLGLDMQLCWPFNLVADLDYVATVISETEDTVTMLDGNGAYLKRHKFHDTTPEHIDFTVKCREDWEKYKPLLTNIDERRINFDAYRNAKANAAKAGRFFAWSGVNVFECMHPICGHENMLAGMALDPDWILDMAKTFTDLTISLQKILFEKEGLPDGIWYYEDMGYKLTPFMSPTMYRELIMPSHKETFEYSHSLGLPVIVHSCGFVEPLLPHMIEAGIDCLQVIEIKAGMDLLRIHKQFGDKIALIGGIDVRELYTNDKARIDAELEAKIPTVMQGFGYVVHSDHSIPKTVEYDTLKYYINKALELGTYK